MDLSRILDWLLQLGDSFAEATDGSARWLTAAVLLVAGWLLGLALQRLARATIVRTGRAVVTPGANAAVREADWERTGRAVGRVVFWLIIALAVMAATEGLGLPVVTTWVSGIASYLPRLVVAVLIVAGGLSIGRLASAAAARAAASSGVADSARAGRLVEVAVLCVTALVAIEALGVDVTFLQVAILIVLGGLLLGAALSFGLGARALVSDIMACHYVRRLYRIGQEVRVRDEGATIDGRILRVVPPWVVLDTPEGEVAVPARNLLSSSSTLLRPPT